MNFFDAETQEMDILPCFAIPDSPLDFRLAPLLDALTP
jgi:hypothetical protein